MIQSHLIRDWGMSLPSDLSAAVEERRAQGLSVLDLIGASVQQEGFEFDQELLADIMAQAVRDARYYSPDALGRFAAREAVAAYHGGQLTPENVLMTPGSSLAYYYAFRLLANPGDDVLCPVPTYPLFDDLAKLAGVSVRRYHLDGTNDGPWRLDLRDLEFQITPRTRAIVLVSPHNPTGMVLNERELSGIADIARRHNLAIVFDEVFREFTHEKGTTVRRPSEFGVPLCLTLNGFSKMFSLPGMKVGWMAVEGTDEVLRREFMNAAAYLNDTFLPMQEAVQSAVAPMLTRGMACCRAAAGLYTQRSQAMAEHFRSCGWRVHNPEAGPYLLFAGDFADVQDEENFAVRLVNEQGIVLHPGTFYSLPPGALVTTAVARPPWPNIVF